MRFTESIMRKLEEKYTRSSNSIDGTEYISKNDYKLFVMELERVGMDTDIEVCGVGDYACVKGTDEQLDFLISKFPELLKNGSREEASWRNGGKAAFYVSPYYEKNLSKYNSEYNKFPKDDKKIDRFVKEKVASYLSDIANQVGGKVVMPNESSDTIKIKNAFGIKGQVYGICVEVYLMKYEYKDIVRNGSGKWLRLHINRVWDYFSPYNVDKAFVKEVCGEDGFGNIEARKEFDCKPENLEEEITKFVDSIDWGTKKLEIEKSLKELSERLKNPSDDIEWGE